MEGTAGSSAAHGHLGDRPRSLLAGALLCVVLLLTPAPSARAESFGKISGVVTDASSHAPLQGIGVCAVSTRFLLSGEEEEEEGEGEGEQHSSSEYEHAFGCTETQSKGEYTIPELRPESYIVEFESPTTSTLDYVSQVYDGKLTLSEATPVPVIEEQTTSGIDAELSLGAEISGTVTELATGAPVVAKGEVCAFKASAGSLESLRCALLEANGTYTIRGLASGSYKIAFVAAGFETQFYNDQSAEGDAEAVSVVAPQHTEGIDAALKPRSRPPVESGAAPKESAPTSKLPTGLAGTQPSSSATGASKLSLASTRVAVASDGDALVKLDCAGASSCPAKVTLKLERMVKLKGKKVLRSITIGKSGVLSVAAGGPVTTRIKLDRTARRLLHAHHGRLQIDVVLATLAGNQIEDVTLLAQQAQRKK